MQLCSAASVCKSFSNKLLYFCSMRTFQDKFSRTQGAFVRSVHSCATRYTMRCNRATLTRTSSIVRLQTLQYSFSNSFSFLERLFGCVLRFEVGSDISLHVLDRQDALYKRNPIVLFLFELNRKESVEDPSKCVYIRNCPVSQGCTLCIEYKKIYRT